MITKRILSIQSNNVFIWYFVFVTWFFLEQILEEKKRARLTRVSPNGCTENGLVISRDRFFHNTIVTSADIFSANGHYPNMPACFISSKGNDISSPFLPKWNYSVATSILYVCWSRVCPFICTDWRSLTGPVGLKNKYIYGQSWKVLKNMKSCYLNRI